MAMTMPTDAAYCHDCGRHLDGGEFYPHANAGHAITGGGAFPRQHPGYGAAEMHGIEHPADGTISPPIAN
jgi:hypothetical protein